MKAKKKKEKSEVIIDAILHSYIYLVVIFKWSEAGVGCFTLSLSHSFIGICSVSFDFQTKKENTRAKKKKCRQDEDAAIEKHIHTKMKKRGKKIWLLSLMKKKRKEKKFALYIPSVLWGSRSDD